MTKIGIAKKLSQGFHSNEGLRQGGSDFPILFKIYIERALKIWKNKCKSMGIEINNKCIYSLQFADDQVLAQDKENLEYMTKKIYEKYEKWGIKINTKQNIFVLKAHRETQ